MAEVWREVAGFPGYLVSSWGRVRGPSGRVLAPVAPHGYPRVTLIQGPHGSRKNALVHRLVLFAFVGPCPAGMEARHLNGDRTDNRLANLAWGTHAANARDRVQHGTCRAAENGRKSAPKQRGAGNHAAKLDWAAVRAIRASAETQRALAARHGVSLATVNLIKLNRTWKE